MMDMAILTLPYKPSDYWYASVNMYVHLNVLAQMIICGEVQYFLLFFLKGKQLGLHADSSQCK